VTVRELQELLEAQLPDADVVIVNEDTGDYWPIASVHRTEDPGGSSSPDEVWLVMDEDERGH
jgi:hypothetical protein